MIPNILAIDMAHVFTLVMIWLCLCGITAVVIVGLIRGWFAEFFWKVGFVLSHVFGGIVDLFCQLWLDVSGLFKRKKFNSKFTGFEKDHEDIG